MDREIKNFYDLEVWKKSHLVVLEIYKTTSKFPKEELFGLISQLKRAASSITANIAEGFARFHYKDKIRFYYNARGSAAEVQNFLILAKDLDYIDLNACKDIGLKLNEVGKLINGLIKSTRKNFD